jgi:hypothetical protein
VKRDDRARNDRDPNQQQRSRKLPNLRHRRSAAFFLRFGDERLQIAEEADENDDEAELRVKSGATLGERL